MNGSEQLKQTWRRSEACETEVQQRIWDNTAARYRELPIPDLAENDFLAELTRHILLTPSVRTLDVGCGSGVYSLALASRGGI